MADKTPAFPVTAPSSNVGMTLRDYFAGQIAAGDASADESGWSVNVADETLRARVRLYYRIADVMLEEREK